MRRGSIALLALALALPVVGCGGGDDDKGSKKGDPEPENPDFHIGADAKPFAGPAPLKVKFSAKPFNAAGDVKWSWKFDDGTTSTDPNPEHTFAKPGYYYVRLRAKDEKTNTAQNFLLGAWPEEVWADASKPGPIDPKQIRKRIRDQHRRTAERKRALGEETIAPGE